MTQLHAIDIIKQFTLLNKMMYDNKDAVSVESHDDSIRTHLYILIDVVTNDLEYVIVVDGFEWRGNWAEITRIAWAYFGNASVLV